MQKSKLSPTKKTSVPSARRNGILTFMGAELRNVVREYFAPVVALARYATTPKAALKFEVPTKKDDPAYHIGYKTTIAEPVGNVSAVRTRQAQAGSFAKTRSNLGPRKPVTDIVSERSVPHE